MRRGADNRRDRGFTLIELLVTLTIMSLVVVTAHGLLGSMTDATRTLAASRARFDRAMNARRTLGEIFLSLEIGQDSTTGFEGRPDQVAFTTWRVSPHGWLEREHVVLRLDGDRLVLEGGRYSTILAADVRALAIDYLLEPGASASWVRQWTSHLSAPLAVRLRLESAASDATPAAVPAAGPADTGEVTVTTDTMLYLIKARG